MAGRAEALSLYRRILRTGRHWKATDPAKTVEERNYIASEARKLFKQNAQISDAETIADCLKEGEARLEIASHYRNPYPRSLNVFPTAMPVGTRRMKHQARLRKQATPAYLRSYV
eukprot:m.28996 g.28996  ORF g.28996 m.28996 type:complete len:115 (-) comp8999_c0_seq1:170-514(-)